MTQPSCRIGICIAGWHLAKLPLELLLKIPDAQLYIISHRPQERVPSNIASHPKLEILFRPNRGYDWGCYQQFIESGLWRAHDYLFFMHDDIQIHKLGFVERAIELLEQGAAVVGNGRNSTELIRPYDRLHYYAHSNWLPPSAEFAHETVRGSFFATTQETLAKLGSFEVFWDPYFLSIGYGNYSLIASSAKMQDLFGANTFAFLSDQYLESEFILEEVRGGVATAADWRNTPRSIALRLYSIFAKREVAYRLKQVRPPLWMRPISLFLDTINGRSKKGGYQKDPKGEKGILPT